MDNAINWPYADCRLNVWSDIYPDYNERMRAIAANAWWYMRH